MGLLKQEGLALCFVVLRCRIDGSIVVYPGGDSFKLIGHLGSFLWLLVSNPRPGLKGRGLEVRVRRSAALQGTQGAGRCGQPRRARRLPFRGTFLRRPATEDRRTVLRYRRRLTRQSATRGLWRVGRQG